tara:strand:- start:238 stop:900 length:663 start_codon:yes stop_codon:yes gene_type:complete
LNNLIRLKEIMDYKNLTLRSISSIVLLFSFFLLINLPLTYIYFLFIFIYLIILYEIIIFFKNQNAKFFLLYLYLFISFISSQIYLIYFFNKNIFIYFIILIISFDSFSYIFGSLFGKKKLIPQISPNKTFLGFFAGFFITFLIAFIINYFYEIYTLINLIIFTLIIIISCFVGDLIESIFKRSSKIDNSSNLIPGHGGFFDRLDGFIMSIISFAIFSYYL